MAKKETISPREKYVELQVQPSKWEEQKKNVRDSVGEILNYDQEEQKEIKRLHSMCWDIEVVEIWKRIEDEIGKKSLALLRKEIRDYNNQLEERLNESRVQDLYKFILKRLNLLPSELITEIEANDNIDKEDESVREFTEPLFWRVKPSLIRENINFFREFVTEDDSEKQVIKNLLRIYADNPDVMESSSYLMPISSMKDQVISYIKIQNTPDVQADIREMMLACVNKWFWPSYIWNHVMFFYDIYYQSWKECIDNFKKDIEEFNISKASSDSIPNICRKYIIKK